MARTGEHPVVLPFPRPAETLDLDRAVAIIGRLEIEKDAMRDRFQTEIAQFRGYCGHLRAAIRYAAEQNGTTHARERLHDALALPIPLPRQDHQEA